MITFGEMTRLLMEDHHTLAGLLQGIIQDRFNAQRWLVLADYLDEQGDPLANMVRISVLMHEPQGLEKWDQVHEEWLKYFDQVRADLRAKDIEPRQNVVTRAWSKQRSVTYKILAHTVLAYKPKRVTLPNGEEGRVAWRPIAVRDLPYDVQRAIIFVLADQARRQAHGAIHEFVPLHGERRIPPRPGTFAGRLGRWYLDDAITRMHRIVSDMALGRRTDYGSVEAMVQELETLVAHVNTDDLTPQDQQQIQGVVYHACNRRPDLCQRLEAVLTQLVKV